MTPRRAWRDGFTLIELLVAISIIGVLSAVVIQAINPAKSLRGAQDVERQSEMNAILKAVRQFEIDRSRLPQFDGNDQIPVGQPSASEICSLSNTHPFIFFCTASGLGYLGELIEHQFLPQIPVDPEHDPTDEYGTDYWIWKDANGRIYVRSPLYNDGAGLTLSQ